MVWGLFLFLNVLFVCSGCGGQGGVWLGCCVLFDIVLTSSLTRQQLVNYSSSFKHPITCIQIALLLWGHSEQRACGLL